MLEKLALVVALMLSLSGNVYQWRHGQERYVSGRTFERGLWEDVIRSKNTELKELGKRATEAETEAARLRAAAADDLLNAPLPVLSQEIVAQCSYTEAVRNAMNRIK